MRTAFVFHTGFPAPSARWLAEMIAEDGLGGPDALAVFPNKSPLRPRVEASGTRCAELDLEESALEEVPAGARAGLAVGKARYGLAVASLLRAHRCEAAFILSGTQIIPGLAASALRIPTLWYVPERHGAGPAFRVKRAVIRACAGVVAFASAECAEAFVAGDLGARVRTIRAGAPDRPADAAARRERLRGELGWRAEELVALYLGPISAAAGVPALLAAWEGVPEGFPMARLALAGDTSADESDRRIAALLAGRAPKAAHLGVREDAMALLLAADLAVLPPDGEPVGGALELAMMAGCPVLSTQARHAAATLDEGTAFLAPTEASLPAALRMALNRGDLRRERAAAAQALALRTLRRKDAAATIRDLLAQLARERRSPQIRTGADAHAD